MPAGFDRDEAVWSGRGRLRRDALEVVQSLEEQSLGGEALGEGDPDAAHAHANLGAELEQTGADAAALGPGQLGVLQSQAAQGAQQDVGEGAEVVELARLSGQFCAWVSGVHMMVPLEVDG